jgi:hypothetical protein
MTMYLVLSAFTSSPISLLVTTKASVFSFIGCSLSHIILTSSALARSWFVPFNVKPPWCTCTLLIVYSKAKLKISPLQASANKQTRAHIDAGIFSLSKTSHYPLTIQSLSWLSVHHDPRHNIFFMLEWGQNLIWDKTNGH